MQVSLDQIFNMLTDIQSSISSLQSDMEAVKKTVSILLSDKSAETGSQTEEAAETGSQTEVAAEKRSLSEETDELLAFLRSTSESLIALSTEMAAMDANVSQAQSDEESLSGECRKIRDMNLEGYETLSKYEKSSFSRAMLTESKVILGDNFSQVVKKVGGTYTFPIEMAEIFQFRLDRKLTK